MFTKLTMDEATHTYYLEGTTLPSVSEMLKQFYVQFDIGVAKYVAQATRRTEADVKNQWDNKRNKAIENGKKVHAFAEAYPLNRSLVPSTDQEVGVCNFFKDYLPKYYIVAIEQKVHDANRIFAGTIDLILYDPSDKTFIIADYKTNEDLFKNYRSAKLLSPFSNLLDNPYNKYKLQLSHYQIALEDLGLPVKDRWIIWLDRVSKKQYKLLHCTDYTKKLRNHYANRRHYIND